MKKEIKDPKFEAFVEKVSKLVHVKKDDFSSGYTGKKLLTPYISVTWSLGASHKNYNGDVVSSSGPEVEPEFTDLFKVLELFWEDISFISYKRLEAECVKKEQYSDNDYYSREERGIKYCYLKDLYNFMVSKGMT